MSVSVGQNVNSKFVNRLLAVNFEIMDNMGETTFKPFLQDVIKFDGLVGSLGRAFVVDFLMLGCHYCFPYLCYYYYQELYHPWDGINNLCHVQQTKGQHLC